jgi:hypothetical protein
MRLCMELAARGPGAVMFSDEIKARWNVQRDSLSSTLATARREGWIVAQKVAGTNDLAYTAGPMLLAERGWK